MIDDQGQNFPNPIKQVDEPSYANEEDVLRVVGEVERERGKKILSEEQREQLLSLKRFCSNQKADVVGVGGMGDVDRAVDVFLFGIGEILEKSYIDVFHYCPRDEWEKKELRVKEAVVDMFFYLTFGMSKKVVRERLVQKFSGGLKHVG